MALDCFKKGPQEVKLEIQAFRIFLESLHTHEASKLRLDADKHAVSRRRQEFVMRKMVEYDSKASMLLQRRTWGWSPLYHAFTRAEGGLPPHIMRPFLHTDVELTALLAWIADDILPRFEVVRVPPPALAMKLLARMWTGLGIPLACPMQGGTMEDIREDVDCLRISCQEVSRLGTVHFPGLDYSDSDLMVFIDSLGRHGPLPDAAEGTIGGAFTWLQMLFFKACNDMVVSGKRDHLSVLWTSGPGVSRNEAARQLREVLLVRENLEFRWVWGGVDCSGKLPEDMSHIVSALAIFQESSMANCTKLLDPWRGGEDSGGSVVPSLGDLPLPSQMYGSQELCLTGKEFVLLGSLADNIGDDGQQGPEEADVQGPEEAADDAEDVTLGAGTGSP
jgi:hypothetical protein